MNTKDIPCRRARKAIKRAQRKYARQLGDVERPYVSTSHKRKQWLAFEYQRRLAVEKPNRFTKELTDPTLDRRPSPKTVHPARCAPDPW